MNETPTLYIIATPIGNLEDITLRALRVLQEVDVVFAEDTRVTKKLFSRYDITTPLVSIRAEMARIEKVFRELEHGKNVALVSDAGTPGISDPGSLVVSRVRERFGSGVEIVPLPGANAAIVALSASGLPVSDFLFLGFLPHKKGRETLIVEAMESKRTVVLYESPHRIERLLASVEEHDPDRKLILARELTKIYEEFLEGTPQELVQILGSDANKKKGEFVVIISKKNRKKKK